MQNMPLSVFPSLVIKWEQTVKCSLALSLQRENNLIKQYLGVCGEQHPTSFAFNPDSAPPPPPPSVICKFEWSNGLGTWH